MELAAVAAATGGTVHADHRGGHQAGAVVVTGPVVTDSRQAGPGSLYVARSGEHADGHDHVADAARRGAVAALTSRPVPELPCVVVPPVAGPSGGSEGSPRPLGIQPADVALGRLAHAVLRRLTRQAGLRVLAVTGSVGKTGTKDLLGQLLDSAGPTVAAEQSYNGEVGVPLTVLRAGPDTRFLVLEMGARGVGHIAYLVGLAPPDVGVVLNVGSAHLGEFGSREAIASAKGELVAGILPGGVAVLNADDPRVAAMAGRAGPGVRVSTVGQSVDAELRAVDVQLDDAVRPSFTLLHRGQREPVRLRLHGEHQVATALSAAGAALAVGMTLPAVAAGLSAATARSRWRMAVTERPDGVTIINDAYNANPESMRAALKTLAQLARGRRSVAVLGEMLELGPDSVGEHDALGRLAVRLDIGRLVSVGAGARAIHLGASQEGSWGGESVWVPDLAAAERYLAGQLSAHDVVLVKSSHDAGLRNLGDRLVAGAPVRADSGAADSGAGDRL